MSNCVDSLLDLLPKNAKSLLFFWNSTEIYHIDCHILYLIYPQSPPVFQFTDTVSNICIYELDILYSMNVCYALWSMQNCLSNSIKTAVCLPSVCLYQIFSTHIVLVLLVKGSPFVRLGQG